MDEHSTSDFSHYPNILQELMVTLELVASEDESEGDPALVLAVGRDTVIALQQEGYIVHPVYTGQKGGFLVEIVTQVMQFIWNYHEEIIADLSGLVTIFGTIIPTIQKMLQAHEQNVGKEGVTKPIKIKIEIDGASIMIEAPDIMQAESALKLAYQYQSVHPNTALQATTNSNIKVQGQIPGRKRRKRR